MTHSDRALLPGVYRYLVAEACAGLRLDQFLAEADLQLSRTLARRLVDLGGVHLAGRRMRRCGEKVKGGDLVEVYVDRLSLRPSCLDPQRILFHDPYLLAIDKPAGMPTQPTPARYKGTVYAELQCLLAVWHGGRQRPSIGMVQRLDQDTSGVMVFSIHPKAHKTMTAYFRHHDIDKTYQALINGVPDEPQGRMRSQLARRRSTNLMVSVRKGGKAAETRYRLVRQLGPVSLVEVALVTGRSHQIRAHFSEAGLPLLGDAAYGGPQRVDGVTIPRQMLHASHLSFRHPVTEEPLTLNAPLPDDFARILQRFDDA